MMTTPRVEFAEGRRLAAGDLNDEQAYLLGLRRVHNLAPHHWGIAWGLEVVAEGNDVRILPGMAVDGYGRELCVAAPLTLPGARLDELLSRGDAAHPGAVLVWLCYHLAPLSLPTPGRQPCGPGDNTRWGEETRVCLAFVAADIALDPRHPAGTPFGPNQPDATNGLLGDVGDDAAAAWPVYLALVAPTVAEHGATRPEAKYSVNARVRPYVGVSGAIVRAASGRTQLTLGAERGSQTVHFAVALPDDHGVLADERLAVDSPGGVTMRGQVTLANQLTPGDFLPPDANSQPSQAAGAPPATPAATTAAPERPLRDLGDRVSDLVLAAYSFQAGDVRNPWSLAGKLAELLSLIKDQASSPLAPATLDGLHRLLELQDRPTWDEATRIVLEVLNALLYFDSSALLPHSAPMAAMTVAAPTQRNAAHPMVQALGAPLRAVTWRMRDDLLQLAGTGSASTVAAAASGAAGQAAGQAAHPLLAATPSAKQGSGEARLRQAAYNRLLLEDLFRAELAPSDRLPGTWGLELRPLVAAPTAATPWSIYRVKVAPKDAPDEVHEELRLEIADPGGKGDPARSLAVIGTRKPATGAVGNAVPEFLPLLAVDAARTVTICGKLTVAGEVVLGPIGADPNDPRLADQIAQQWGQGAGAALNRFAISNIDVKLELGDLKAGKPWSYTVKLTNKADNEIKSVVLYESVSLGELATGKTLQVVESIKKGETHDCGTITHSELLPAQGKLMLQVTAFTPATLAVAYGSQWATKDIQS